MTNNSPVIECNDLGKDLVASGQIENKVSKSLHILSKINLKISQGESVAVILLDKKLSLLDEDQRAALRLGKVGFVFQSFHLMDNLTALENVMLPLELDRSSSLKNNVIRQQSQDALIQVGLEHRINHLSTQLSGGEQQRVALARAFVTNPSVLFADEPTGNLDSNTGKEIVDLLFSMQKKNNTTLVLVTHDDALAEQCQTHYRIDNGGIKNARESHTTLSAD